MCTCLYGQVTCNDEHCNQLTGNVDVHIEPPTPRTTTTEAPPPITTAVPISTARPTRLVPEYDASGVEGSSSFGSRDVSGQTGPIGAPGVPGIPGSPGVVGPLPDMTYYSQQMADLYGSNDKGPNAPMYGPDNFQYVQAQVGPVGQRGASGPGGPIGPQGFQGTRGEAGDSGPMGPMGAPGPRGMPGTPGKDGEAGEDGEIGATGAAGPPGPRGFTGMVNILSFR